MAWKGEDFRRPAQSGMDMTFIMMESKRERNMQEGCLGGAPKEE